jgi:Tfp pilus assembly protein PilN
LNGHANSAGFVALSRAASGAVEVYGESASRPVFSAEFDAPPQRAAILALSELRLPPETAPLQLAEVLPKPSTNPVENDLSRNALPYATALAGACPRLAPSANVLPLEHRRFNSRAVFIPSIVLAVLVLLVAGGMMLYSKYAERQYLAQLQAEINRLAPMKQRADALDRETDQDRLRMRMLDQYRGQTRYDLDTLNELTRLVEPPAWTNSVQVTRENVTLNGEAPQPTTLVKTLDSSPFFKNTNLPPYQKAGNVYQFQIMTNRAVHP